MRLFAVKDHAAASENFKTIGKLWKKNEF